MLKKSLATTVLIASCFCFTISGQVSELQESRQTTSYTAIRNEINVIRTLHAIHNAQYTYLATRGAGTFGLLIHLSQAGLIDETLATGYKHGYLFTLSKLDRSVLTPSTYRVIAVPQMYGRTGRRSFYLDESGIIRSVDSQDLPATVNDQPLSGAEQCLPFTNCEAATIQSLRTMHAAQLTFQATTGNGNFGSLRQLLQAGLVDTDLAAGQKYGFSYVMVKRDHTNQSPATFALVVIPKSREFGFRSFYIDDTGILRASPGGWNMPADQGDMPY